MRHFFNFLIIFTLFSIFVGGFFYWWDRRVNFLVSPVLGISGARIAANVWLPKPIRQKNQGELNITAKAVLFINPATGEVLYEKNSTNQYSIASLVKIMTAVVAMDQTSGDWNKVFSVSRRASDMEPDKMLLVPGERLTLKGLLQGLFLVSANDAAEVIAEETMGSRADFIKLMNEKGKQLGMKNTIFLNPTGLEEDWGKQYSSAYDVILMARFAIKNWPKLLEITSSEHIFIPATKDHQDYDLYSGINLITTYPGVMGFKTGFTPEAGLTLVTFAEKQGKQVLGVILGSSDRRDDAKLLLDYSFKKLSVSD